MRARISSATRSAASLWGAPPCSSAELAALQRRAERQRALVAVLREGTCADCGSCPPVRAQFDHVPARGPKLGDISTLLGKWTGWAKLRAELAKCDLVCGHCHWQRTMQRRGGLYMLLSEADRDVIRARRAAGSRNKDLAAEYGVSPSHISNVTTGALTAA
jgi:hypothetical protein